MFNPSKHVSVHSTPQTAPIPGSAQVASSAGGYSFQVDQWDQLDRFLILGSEGGSYYAGERELTIENAKCIEKCLATDGKRTVERITEISTSGRAPKNDAAIFALALALKKGDELTRKMARTAVPRVCRIGTHIFQFAQAVSDLGGWGRGTKGAFADWYLSQSDSQLGQNLVKYQNRNGWTHRDVLRQAHVVPKTDRQKAQLRWAVGKITEGSDPQAALLDPKILAFEQAKVIAKGGVSPATTYQIVNLINTYGLPRECVPTEFLNEIPVWDALLRGPWTNKAHEFMRGSKAPSLQGEVLEEKMGGMPFTAMIRNLGKMTSMGLLKPMSDASGYVVQRLSDSDGLKRARVHPFSILLAMSTYKSGHGFKGSLTWSPVQPIVDALHDAFYESFKFVEPSNKRWLLGIDVSGSMGSSFIAGSNLSAREGAMAMAMVTARTEPAYHMFGFSHRFVELPITAKTDLAQACEITSRLPFERTDCSLPVEHAIQHSIPVDVFVVYTDSETYAGRRHPKQALDAYRQVSGINAKLIVVGMVANQFTIADPNDPGMLDVVGFDSDAPSVMSGFVGKTEMAKLKR